MANDMIVRSQNMANDMIWLGSVVLLGAAGALLVAVGVRVLVGEAQAEWWRRSVTAFELRMPRDASTGDLERWLSALWTLVPQRRRWSVLPHRPICIEITADQRGIKHVVLVPRRWRTHVLSTVAATLPGARLTEGAAAWAHRPRFACAVELRLRGAVELLAVQRAAATSRHVLAALQPLAAGEAVRVQWLLTGAPPPRCLARSDTEAEAVPAMWRSGPVLRAVCRVAVASPAGRHHSAAVLHRVWAALSGMNTARTRIGRAWLPRIVVAARMAWRVFPAGRWPMAVTAAELSGLLAAVSGETGLPGLPAEIARTLPLPSSMPQGGLVLAASNYPGTEATLQVSSTDRLRHMWIIGPTGTGKSTLLANIINHDIAHGDGLVLIDAGGDLVADVLDRIPENRADDVIVIDPTHTDHIVGLNPLTAGPPEQAAGFTYHVLYSIWERSWGPRTADIVRACLLTLTATKAPDGSAFTLVDIPELLTNAAFRKHVTAQPLPAPVMKFWRDYDRMPEPQQASVISPVLNKLRTFTLSTSLRATFGQSGGVRFADVLAEGRIVLVPLKKAILGDEVSALLGALVMASVWQATQVRVNMPKEQRRPMWLVADEFQETVRLPLALADMAARARSLGLGLILAHQYLRQLPESVKAAVLDTVRTQILFQIGLKDAGELAPSFAPLTATDLHHLGAYEIAARICTDGATGPAVTGRTYPAPPPVRDGAALAADSRARHGRPLSEIDEHIATRTTPPTTRSGAPWGRIVSEGEQ